MLQREYKDWIMNFKRLHNLKTFDEAIEKLIDIHRAWNEKYNKPDKRKV